MYSTLNGAKKCAKQLRHILHNCHLIYPLAKCQEAVAKAGGYSDWHDLTQKIANREQRNLPYDYWGRLIDALPEPCHSPVESYLVSKSDERSETDLWKEYILPYCSSLEKAHRIKTSMLQPGSGKNHKLRLEIFSTILLYAQKCCDPLSKLDPESMTMYVQGVPNIILPGLAEHPDFTDAIGELIAENILRVDGQGTRILVPTTELRVEILRQAREWNIQKESEISYVIMDEEIAAAVQLQSNLDRAEAGPKTSYHELEYLGVNLQSRYSVAHEFQTMKAVVDVMPTDVRLRISSIWCDSKACADYSITVILGLHRSGLPEQIRDCFLLGSDGFNGLLIEYGTGSTFFDPEWPDEYEEFA